MLNAMRSGDFLITCRREFNSQEPAPMLVLPLAIRDFPLSCSAVALLGRNVVGGLCMKMDTIRHN